MTIDIDKENRRCSYEWDAFLSRWPEYVYGKDSEADQEALLLAQKQGSRLAQILNSK